MRNLVSPFEKVHGCELYFPDTVFMDSRGQVTDIIRTDKDGFVVSQKNASRIKK